MVTKDEIIEELKQQQKCLTHKNVLAYCDLCLAEQHHKKEEEIKELKRTRQSWNELTNKLTIQILKLQQELCEQRKYNNNANKKIQKLEETLISKMQDDTFIRMDRDMLKKFKEFCKNG